MKRSLALASLALACLLLASQARAQAIIKVNDDVFIKFGVQLQAWADWQQDAAPNASGDQGYAQNLFLRRGRFLIAGQFAKDISFFVQTDSPNLGKATGGTKTISSGFILQDGFLEWKIDDAFMLGGGLYIVPLARNELQSTLRFITIDISPTSTVFAAPTATVGTRDTGFYAKGYLVDGGRLEYRASVAQGVRDVGSHNAFRYTGYLQYNFLEKENAGMTGGGAAGGYVFSGTNLGTRKILGVSGGVDTQKTYTSYSAAGFGTLPLAQGNEVAFIGQWVHYDGGTFLATLPQQNDYLAELGFYIKSAKVQPFGKYEAQRFSQTAKQSGDLGRWGLGLNYFVHGQNLKLTAQYTRVDPKTTTATFKATNEFTVQLQAFYF